MFLLALTWSNKLHSEGQLLMRRLLAKDKCISSSVYMVYFRCRLMYRGINPIPNPKCVFNKLACNFIEITIRYGHASVNLLHNFKTSLESYYCFSERLFFEKNNKSISFEIFMKYQHWHSIGNIFFFTSLDKINREKPGKVFSVVNVCWSNQNHSLFFNESFLVLVFALKSLMVTKKVNIFVYDILIFCCQ